MPINAGPRMSPDRQSAMEAHTQSSSTLLTQIAVVGPSAVARDHGSVTALSSDAAGRAAIVTAPKLATLNNAMARLRSSTARAPANQKYKPMSVTAAVQLQRLSHATAYPVRATAMT